MKLFTNKNLIQKLIIAIVAVTLLNFCIAPMQVKASIGGTLAKPIRDLAVTIGDALISIAQYGVMGTWIDAVERAANAETTGGKDFWVGSVKYPIIQISPELIFSNQIEILSIDFIGGPDKENGYIIEAKKDENGNGALDSLRKVIAGWYVTLRTVAAVGLLSVLLYIGIRIIISSTSQDKAKYKQRIIDWIVAFCILFFMHYIMAGMITVIGYVDEALTGGADGKIDAVIPLNLDYGNVKFKTTIGNLQELADATDQAGGMASDSEEERARNAAYEWFSNNGYKNITVGPAHFEASGGAGGDGYSVITITCENTEGIKKTVSIQATINYTLKGEKKITWGLSRAGTGNSDSDVATMKEMNELPTYVNNTSHGNTVVIPTTTQTATQNKETQTSTEETDNRSDTNYGSNAKATISGADKIDHATLDYNYKNQPIIVYDGARDNGDSILYYINYARLYCNANSDHSAEGFGFTAIYLVLVIFTLMFLFRYIKRVIYVAFLTIIAPLVALTYPLDKIKDGKAQAFNMWFREYIFNALIQPFHLIIYTILVGSATALAHSYPIYAVVAIAFLIPAEKLMRKFFGFDGAGTLSAAGSFAGGALFSTMLQRINRPKRKRRRRRRRRQRK